MANGRIPSTIAKFNTYIVRTNAYLQVVIVPTNGIRVGLTALNISDWNIKELAWVKLYLLYCDPLTRTSDINKQVKTFMKNFRTFAQPLLNIVAASPNAIDSDGTAFNVVLKRKKPTHPTEKITAKIFVLYELLGGGMMKSKCRTLTDGKRASLAAGADSVQIAYVLGDEETKAPDPDSGMIQQVITKATFINSFGAVNSRKILYIYFRWYNTKYPELASPWSGLYIIPLG